MKNPLTTRQSGSTMIEVLVSMIIIAIGLLGFAGLLTQAMKSSQTAYLRSQATFLAYDIVERMRANRGAAINGNYSITYEGTPVGGNLAGDDLVDWRASITQALPAGSGDVSAVLNGSVTIKIKWNDGHEQTEFITQSAI
jgi:type IV pilus assembly protein PilV